MTKGKQIYFSNKLIGMKNSIELSSNGVKFGNYHLKIIMRLKSMRCFNQILFKKVRYRVANLYAFGNPEHSLNQKNAKSFV